MKYSVLLEKFVKTRGTSLIFFFSPNISYASISHVYTSPMSHFKLLVHT
jgi:hypothetical protein